MRVYGWVFRTVLRRVDAERVHRASLAALRILAAAPGGLRLIRWTCRVPAVPVDALGLRFANPVGLAAGFDKDASCIDGLAALGFGFVEIGTVTAQAQPGNPRPRLFRLVGDRAIVNRMGFNNAGAPAVAARLARRVGRVRRARQAARGPIVGVNIGRTKAVPAEQSAEDYATSAALLAPYADYLVVNVSSPNTPGLRDLQAVDELRPLLESVRRAGDHAAGRRLPLLVKIAPDLADDDVHAVADLAVEIGLDGIIATNTTVSRSGLAASPEDVAAAGAGGLSGAPLRTRSLEVLELLRRRVGSSLTVISVGGIESAADAAARLRAGADLVQAYTGFVYGGPLWPRRTVRGLAATVQKGSA
ncbi:MAG TPA: quinone-dependent dihydroorotate dehydrogenase [Jiangellaceae bacterium]|nr:quinone-dependent dihydroorotate dehydrogenase [Jiangellaceae bacterium]